MSEAAAWLRHNDRGQISRPMGEMHLDAIRRRMMPKGWHDVRRADQPRHLALLVRRNPDSVHPHDGESFDLRYPPGAPPETAAINAAAIGAWRPQRDQWESIPACTIGTVASGSSTFPGVV